MHNHAWLPRSAWNSRAIGIDPCKQARQDAQNQTPRGVAPSLADIKKKKRERKKGRGLNTERHVLLRGRPHSLQQGQQRHNVSTMFGKVRYVSVQSMTRNIYEAWIHAPKMKEASNVGEREAQMLVSHAKYANDDDTPHTKTPIVSHQPIWWYRYACCSRVLCRASVQY